MSTPLAVPTFVAALGCGIIGGVFFAFSTFIMKALALLPPAQGIAAMQSINRVVLNRWFLGIFFGAGILCLAIGIHALFSLSNPGSVQRLAGSTLYLIGTIGVTIACNVPRNNQLASLNASSSSSVPAWQSYLSSWTFWNHVRTIAAIAAAAILFLPQ